MKPSHLCFALLALYATTAAADCLGTQPTVFQDIRTGDPTEDDSHQCIDMLGTIEVNCDPESERLPCTQLRETLMGYDDQVCVA